MLYSFGAAASRCWSIWARMGAHITRGTSIRASTLSELTGIPFTCYHQRDPMSDSGSTESESDSQGSGPWIMKHTGLTQPVLFTPRSEARFQERQERIRNETPYYKRPPVHTGLTPGSSQESQQPNRPDSLETTSATLATPGGMSEDESTADSEM